jgi:hypothetical protein
MTPRDRECQRAWDKWLKPRCERFGWSVADTLRHRGTFFAGWQAGAKSAFEAGFKRGCAEYHDPDCRGCPDCEGVKGPFT